MKIILAYKEPETQIAAYMYESVYDESEVKEAVEELKAAKEHGYEIVRWALVHDEDA